jgi:hypothetical protein
MCHCIAPFTCAINYKHAFKSSLAAQHRPLFQPLDNWMVQHVSVTCTVLGSVHDDQINDMSNSVNLGRLLFPACFPLFLMAKF